MSSAIGGDKVVSFRVRPNDDGWIMGEDLEVSLTVDTTIRGLMKHIEDAKGISRHRQLLRPIFKSNGINKLIPPNKLDWALRRYGFFDGVLIHVEPTRPGAWIWHPIEHYIRESLNRITSAIDKAGGCIDVDELAQKVKLPPPIKLSMKVFLRKYPERVLLRCDTTTNRYWAERAKVSVNGEISLPYFGYASVSTAPLSLPNGAPTLDGRQFDWDVFADIDENDKIEELDFEIPLVSYWLRLVNARLDRLPIGSDAFSLATNPYAVVYFEGEEVYRSACKRLCSRPSWHNAAFQVAIQAGKDLKDCKLVVELWNYAGVADNHPKLSLPPAIATVTLAAAAATAVTQDDTLVVTGDDKTAHNKDNHTEAQVADHLHIASLEGGGGEEVTEPEAKKTTDENKMVGDDGNKYNDDSNNETTDAATGNEKKDDAATTGNSNHHEDMTRITRGATTAIAATTETSAAAAANGHQLAVKHDDNHTADADVQAPEEPPLVEFDKREFLGMVEVTGDELLYLLGKQTSHIRVFGLKHHGGADVAVSSSGGVGSNHVKEEAEGGDEKDNVGDAIDAAEGREEHSKNLNILLPSKSKAGHTNKQQQPVNESKSSSPPPSSTVKKNDNTTTTTEDNKDNNKDKIKTTDKNKKQVLIDENNKNNHPKTNNKIHTGSASAAAASKPAAAAAAAHDDGHDSENDEAKDIHSSSPLVTTSSAAAATGWMRIEGGRSGFEIQILGASGLDYFHAADQKEGSRALVSVLWDGREIGRSIPDRSNTATEPVWSDFRCFVPSSDAEDFHPEGRFARHKLEIQVWSSALSQLSVLAAKGRLLGRVEFTGSTLIDMFLGRHPWATFTRAKLMLTAQQSDEAAEPLSLVAAPTTEDNYTPTSREGGGEAAQSAAGKIVDTTTSATGVSPAISTAAAATDTNLLATKTKKTAGGSSSGNLLLKGQSQLFKAISGIKQQQRTASSQFMSSTNGGAEDGSEAGEVTEEAREDVAAGFVTLLTGPSGLPQETGRYVEIAIISAENINPSTWGVYVTVDWNYQRIARSQLFRVPQFDEDGNPITDNSTTAGTRGAAGGKSKGSGGGGDFGLAWLFSGGGRNKKKQAGDVHLLQREARVVMNFRVNVDVPFGSKNCGQSHLRIHLFEVAKKAHTLLGCCGQLTLDGADLSSLLLTKNPVVRSFGMTDGGRGKLKIRGGPIGRRTDEECIITVNAALTPHKSYKQKKNEGMNEGKQDNAASDTDGESSSHSAVDNSSKPIVTKYRRGAYAVLHWNGEQIGETTRERAVVHYSGEDDDATADTSATAATAGGSSGSGGGSGAGDARTRLRKMLKTKRTSDYFQWEDQIFIVPRKKPESELDVTAAGSGDRQQQKTKKVNKPAAAPSASASGCAPFLDAMTTTTTTNNNTNKNKNNRSNNNNTSKNTPNDAPQDDELEVELWDDYVGVEETNGMPGKDGEIEPASPVLIGRLTLKGEKLDEFLSYDMPHTQMFNLSAGGRGWLASHIVNAASSALGMGGVSSIYLSALGNDCRFKSLSEIREDAEWFKMPVELREEYLTMVHDEREKEEKEKEEEEERQRQRQRMEAEGEGEGKEGKEKDGGNDDDEDGEEEEGNNDKEEEEEEEEQDHKKSDDVVGTPAAAVQNSDDNDANHSYRKDNDL